jgi:hypothetical protein
MTVRQDEGAAQWNWLENAAAGIATMPSHLHQPAVLLKLAARGGDPMIGDISGGSGRRDGAAAALPLRLLGAHARKHAATAAGKPRLARLSVCTSSNRLQRLPPLPHRPR